MKKRVLYVYRGPREVILSDALKGLTPDSMLFGLNHLRTLGYHVDFFDDAFLRLNVFKPLFFPLEQIIIRDIGMGFKLDQATLLLPKIKDYDVIVCTSDSAGLPFLFYKHLGIIKKPLIILGSGLPGALLGNQDSWVTRLYRKIFASITVIAVYSHLEADFYQNILRVPKDRICIIPYGTDWQFWQKKSNKKRTIISAVGVDSGRDYKTFFEAIRNISIPAVVLCHPDNVRGISMPKNVRCEFLVGYQRVREVFQTSRVVVVPCKEHYRSAGQMVVLEASSTRTPAIASKITGLISAFDLVDKKHLLYVDPEDPIDLRRAIEYLLKIPKRAQTLGRRASLFVRDHYTSKHLAENIADIIDST